MCVRKTIAFCMLCMFFAGTFIIPSTQLYSIEEDILTSLDDFTLEDLLNISVTTASGREQDLMTVSNTMTVITRQDIERSGARHIQELFYRVPGMHIRRYDGHNFGIGMRRNPMEDTLAIDMLVLVDGTIVFNPIINGTIWNSIPVSIDEIEQIEIIRGPGGVLYSANAVMGVINIITKSAKETGNYASIKGGTQLYGSVSGGFGFKPFENSDLYFRTFYHFDRDEGFRKKGTSKGFNDDLRKHIFGFRFDYEFSEDTKATVSFKRNDHDVTNLGVVGGYDRVKQHASMSTVSAHLSHTHNHQYDFDVNFWYKHAEDSFTRTNDVIGDSLDFKTQHNFHFDLFGTHVLSAGAELLLNWTEVDNHMVHPEDSQRIASVFVQEEYRPIESLIFTAGFRMDDNTNVQHQRASWQPRFSVMYLPTETQSIRLTVSRMIRQTTFAEYDTFSVLAYNPSFPSVPILSARGTADINPETYWTYEAGYRGLWFDKKLNIDAVGYVTNIDNLVIFQVVGTSLPTTIDFLNNGELRIYGFELNFEYELLDNLFLLGDYSFVNYDDDPDFSSTAIQNIEKKSFNTIFGFGVRYTWRDLKIDMYTKYFEHGKFTSDGIRTTSSQSLAAFFTTLLRIAYEFKIPGTGDIDAEVELIARDIHAKRRIETERNYLVSPQIWGGVKIKF